MTEFITKEELAKLVSANSSIDCTGAHYLVEETFYQAINLAIAQKLEVVGYVQDGYADKIKLYGDTLVTKNQSTLRQTPLYAIRETANEQ